MEDLQTKAEYTVYKLAESLIEPFVNANKVIKAHKEGARLKRGFSSGHNSVRHVVKGQLDGSRTR